MEQYTKEPSGWDRHSMLGWLKTLFGELTSPVQTQLDGKLETLLLYSDETANADGSSGTEDDLTSYTIPAGTIAADGDGMLVLAWFIGDGTDTVTLRTYLDTDSDILESSLFGNGGAGQGTVVLMWIRRTSSSTCSRFAVMLDGAGDDIRVDNETGISVTWANANVLKFTGQRTSGSGSANITQISMLVVHLT